MNINQSVLKRFDMTTRFTPLDRGSKITLRRRPAWFWGV